MQTAQGKVTAAPPRIPRWLSRVASLCLLAVMIGWGLQWSLKVAHRGDAPAGLTRGIMHGALMPIAMPNLLLGKDVPIYADNNTGVSYKLGYTLGVNICGIIFFGFLFTRLNRLRKPAASKPAK